ncbi:hypothetical protein MATL_G00253900 [Megalops atlanticus]|uniref:G-protein coupled receptors family 1 profile domain-containing protein n=1 Tax=Megalops atlanticus TaxID=7932 RepID=A0A9D3PC35_MEGAT|nr:hypothetical protein MATL_G00253900 [Megalops atlanticus]
MVRNRFSYGHGRLLIACAWAYALVFACSPLARWGVYGPEPYGTACCIDWRSSNTQSVAKSYTVVLFVCCYLLPCGVIVASYAQILAAVRRSRRAVKQHVSPQSKLSNFQAIIVKLSVAVCIGFFAAWSPYAVVSMWAAFGHIENIPPLAFALPAMFAKSSTLYNPIIYLMLRPYFRKVMCREFTVLQQACLRNCFCTERLVKCNSTSIVQEEASVEQKQTPKRQQAAKKSVRVFVRGKRNAEIDCLEITLEAVPARVKTAWR